MSGDDGNADVPSDENDDDILTEEDRRSLEEFTKNYANSIVQQRQLDFVLPETVTVIECNNGTKVFLIGTAHFSQESNDEVVKIISLTRPDFVLVELCPNRSHVLFMSEEKIKEEAKKISVFQHIKANGFSHGVMQYLMLRLNSYLIDTLGMAPGGEFRAAAQAASDQFHCHIVLGDRPIDVTLHRMFNSLGFWSKLCFAYSLLSGLEPITKEQIEEMKKGDILEQILVELGGSHPELKTAVLDERDLYLAKSIWNLSGMAYYQSQETVQSNGPLDESDTPAARRIPFGDRLSSTSADEIAAESTVSDGAFSNINEIPPCCARWPSPSVIPRVIVAVVGIGHVAGIKKHWDTVHSVDQNELMKMVEPPLSWKACKWGIRLFLISSVAALCYGTFKGVTKLGSVVWRAFG